MDLFVISRFECTQLQGQYLPRALKYCQVYFWRNCTQLLQKNVKISQEHHWLPGYRVQFVLSYEKDQRSFPNDSSLPPQSGIKKYIYIFSQFYNCMYQNILAKKEWSLHSITTNFLTTCSTFLISFAAPQSKTKILRVFEYVYYYLIGKQWKQFHIMWGPTVNSMLYSEIWTSNNLFAPIFLKRCWCSFLSQIIVLS